MIRKIIKTVERVFHWDEFGTLDPPALTSPQLHQHGGGVEAWRPIASYPKTGEEFEVLYDSGLVEQDVYWSDTRYCMLGAPMGSRGPGLLSTEAGHLPIDPEDGITHWRPASPIQNHEVCRWRIFEDTTHGYWGIELEQAGNDDDAIMYPIKIHRDTVARIVEAHNAPPAHPTQSDVSCSRAREGGTVWPDKPPARGKNWDNGEWSRRNYDAMIEDFRAASTVGGTE